MTSSTFAPTAAMTAAQRGLLEPNDIDERLIASLLVDLAGTGNDFADLFFEAGTREEWGLSDGRVTQGSYALTQGIGARAVAGDRVSFAYSSELTPGALQALVRGDASDRRQGQGRDPESKAWPFHEVALAVGAYPSVEAGAGFDAIAKIDLLRRIDASARASDPRIIKVSAQLTVSDKLVLHAALDHSWAADVRPLVEISVTVLAQSGERRARGVAGVGGRMAILDIGADQVDAAVQRAARMALVMLDARPAPAGETTVVLGHGFPGVLLHEAVGHGLEGDAHRKRSSVFAGKLGEQVAAKGVTVVDDATLAGLRGSLNVDDEGSPGERTVLIEDGKLVGLMQDRLNARLLNQVTTGNARRQSYAHLPMPRMTNTFLEAGVYDPAEIIASVKNGIYAPEFGGGTVDITSGQFNFSATEAYLIEDGKITAPISGATLIGLGHQTLQHISMIGSDLAMDMGACSKEGQIIPVGVGQPTVKIDTMVVGGTATR